MTGQQLKNSILQLAIQGKLVPQDPNDEPASVLLEMIRKEKEQMVKDGKLKKKDLETTPITDDEKPFEIPESWEWVRMKEIISHTNAGKSPNCQNRSKRDNEWGVIKTTAVQDGFFLADENKVLPENFIVQEEQTVKFEDLLITRAGPRNRTGVVCVVNSPCDNLILSDKTVRLSYLRGFASPYYLMFCLNSPLVHSMVEESMVGMASSQVNISQDSMKEFRIPLPPLKEQQRIVAKIEELLPLVEEYDKAQKELDALNTSLPEALKKSILQEAIQGKLVPQDPNDEPASVLLEKIRKVKEQLVKEGKLKKKDLITTPISDDEKPFDIPESWEWCRLGDLGIFERGNGIKRDETLTEGYPCVRYGEMYTKYRYSSTFDKTCSFTSKLVFEACRKAHKGDLFMALTGENKQDIALAAQYIGDEEIAVGGDLCHFTILQAFALYFVYLINSPYYSSKKEVLATGDIIVHISADKLGSIPIPLPPLAEQKRIVAKIEELYKSINNL